MPKSTSKALKDILEYDILRSSFVDQVDIFRKFTVLEKQIYQSIKEKKKEFHKPARIKSMGHYAMPMRIQGIKASVAYNEIKDHDDGIDSIAIPADSEIPDWVVPFIDYNTIIQDNLRSFPLDELGLSKNESKDVTHTNIMRFG